MESGRAYATDRGSGGLGLAEGIVLRLFFHVVTPSGPRCDHGVHGSKRSGDARAMAQELSSMQTVCSS